MCVQPWKEKKFGTSSIETRQVVILLEIRCKSNRERSEESVGSALGSGWALPCTTLLSALSPAWVQTLPLLCGQVCSPWFSLVWIPGSGARRQFNGLGSTSMEQDPCWTNVLLQPPLGISGGSCISQLCEYLRCWMISPSNLFMVNAHTIEV